MDEDRHRLVGEGRCQEGEEGACIGELSGYVSLAARM